MAIVKGALNPASAGTTTFPELDNIQVTAPNRHSVDPTLILDFANSRTLDPRVTFSRGSNATFYDGSTALAEQNLLKYSQDFTNLWSASGGATFSPTLVTAPDGTTTATGLVEDNTSNWHEAAPTSAQWTNGSAQIGLTYTFSLFVKAGTRSVCCLYIADSTDRYANFNLTSSGSVTATSGVTASIYLVGNGWYRCSITRQAVTNFMRPTIQGNVFGPYTGTTSAIPIYIWGAQMETRSVATAYTATTTTTINNNIPVLKTAGPNQPRFDIGPLTLESKGLLLEEQRTNLLTYSSDLTNTGWSSQGVTVRTNSAIAPDGTQTAATAIASSTSESQNIASLHNSPAGVSTFSIFAKAAGQRYVQCLHSRSAGGDSGYVTFDLNTGVITNSSVWTGSIVSVGNGWYRLIATTSSLTGVSNGSNVRWALTDGSASRGVSFQGNSFNGVHFWGAQAESGAFVTSYIPTVAATATRTFDYPVISGTNFSSWFNNISGTVYVEAMAGLNTASGGNAFVYLVDSAQGPQNDLYLDTDSGNGRFFAWDRGSAVVSMNLSTVTAGTSYKVAAAYKLNDYAASKNGNAVVTDTNATVPAGLSQMIIGRDIFNALSPNTTIKKIAYYPVRLTNAELVSMTTA